MKTYSKMPDGTAERVGHLLKCFHEDVLKAGVKIDLVSVATDADAPALMLHGYPCGAIVRVVSTKDRAKGHGDVEIQFDEAKWLDMDEAQRDALADHELEHIELVLKNGAVKRDSAGRPKIKMKKHDVDFGWFSVIAQRHGIASTECRQAASLFLDGRQTFFAFIGNKGEVKALT